MSIGWSFRDKNSLTIVQYFSWRRYWVSVNIALYLLCKFLCVYWWFMIVQSSREPKLKNCVHRTPSTSQKNLLAKIYWMRAQLYLTSKHSPRQVKPSLLYDRSHVFRQKSVHINEHSTWKYTFVFSSKHINKHTQKHSDQWPNKLMLLIGVDKPWLGWFEIISSVVFD